MPDGSGVLLTWLAFGAGIWVCGAGRPQRSVANGRQQGEFAFSAYLCSGALASIQCCCFEPLADPADTRFPGRASRARRDVFFAQISGPVTPGRAIGRNPVGVRVAGSMVCSVPRAEQQQQCLSESPMLVSQGWVRSFKSRRRNGIRRKTGGRLGGDVAWAARGRLISGPFTSGRS